MRKNSTFPTRLQRVCGWWKQTTREIGMDFLASITKCCFRVVLDVNLALKDFMYHT